MSPLFDGARELLTEIWRRDRVLAIAGWAHVGLLAAALLVAPFDTRVVTGLNPWIKPMKFTVSIAVYLWTLAWLLPYTRGPRWTHQVVRWGATGAMAVEIACITLQAARGRPSHFNVATTLDAAIFNVMGALIASNTAIAGVVLGLFLFRASALRAAYLWGIRLGLLLFLLGSLEGAVMIARGAHTVGLPDGGPGLPFLNWSTQAGDLRVAHLLGLHALQAIPLAGFLLSRSGRLPDRAQVAAVGAIAVAYAWVAWALFRQAMAGRPFLG